MTLPYKIDYEKAKDEFIYHADQFLTRDKSGKGWICPICRSGDGPNGTGIIMQTKSRTGGKQEFSCFGRGQCFKQQDLLDIIALKYGITVNEGNFTKIIEKACEEFNYFPEYVLNKGKTSGIDKVKKQEEINKRYEAEQNLNHYKNFIFKAYENLDLPDATRMLNERGISLKTAKLASKVGFDTSGIFSFRGLIFTDGENYDSFSIRNEDPNSEFSNRWRKHGPSSFFNFSNVKEGKAKKPYYLVEGELDCLSILEVGADAVSLGSTSNIEKFIQKLKHENLNRPIIIAMDNDVTGKRAKEKLIEKLKEINVFNFSISSLEGFQYKDSNEFLCSNRELFEKCIKEDLEKFEDEDSDFKSANILAKKYLNKLGRCSQPVSTGYPILDDILGGGLHNGAVYCLGAPSGVGKTSFSQTIADNAAKGGQNVIYFTFEMSSYEMILKTITRISFLEGFENPLTVNDFDDNNFNKLDKFKRKHLERTFNNYINGIGKHMFLNEGEIGEVTIETVEEVIESFIEETKERPLVFLDYLQVLQQPRYLHGNKSEKQITDYNIFKLKRMARKFNCPIFVISSFNRQSYDAPTMSAFKESGSIEFTADCILTLFPNVMGLKKRDAEAQIRKEESTGVREVVLSILKNRRGRFGNEILFKYRPANNYFEEISKIN